jgi:hypothetical protein
MWDGVLDQNEQLALHPSAGDVHHDVAFSRASSPRQDA